jgi:hypothetical protein
VIVINWAERVLAQAFGPVDGQESDGSAQTPAIEGVTVWVVETRG